MRCHSLPELVVAVRSSAVDEDGAAASFAGVDGAWALGEVAGDVKGDACRGRTGDVRRLDVIAADDNIGGLVNAAGVDGRGAAGGVRGAGKWRRGLMTIGRSGSCSVTSRTITTRRGS